jgi:hypothetical protein
MKQIASRALFHSGIFKKGIVGRELRRTEQKSSACFVGMQLGIKKQKYEREAGRKSLQLTGDRKGES